MRTMLSVPMAVLMLIAVGPRHVEAGDPVTPASSPAGRLATGRVELLGRERHGNYEKATFSFEHEVRDDPDLARTRNDWELEFCNGGDVFGVRMVKDDRSTILDLGPKRLEDIVELTSLPATPARGGLARVPAVDGHTYLVHTRDSDSDHLALFRVESLVPGDRCEIAWVRWIPDPPKAGTLELDVATRQRLARALAAAMESARAALLKERLEINPVARVRFQIRTQAQGGNRSRLSLAGSNHRVAEQAEATPFDVRTIEERRRDPRWFVQGGLVPEGKVLVIEAIDVYAEAAGDSNGDGEATVGVPGERVFSVRDEEGPFQVYFEGRALVRPGEEEHVEVSVANSSALDVIMRGKLVDAVEARKLAQIPFVPSMAPATLERPGGTIEHARDYLLSRPVARLQVRAGAGGGNPNRVTLLGKGSIYLDRLTNQPIATSGPVEMREQAVGYTSGGRIPRGKIWVVTRVTWEGTAAGDSNGPGEMIVHVGGTELAKVRDTDGPLAGEWDGEIRVGPGQEARVYVEVANSSAVSATFEGHFEDA